MIIYTAGKYSGDVDANIAVARVYAIKLWEAGHVVICPHLNTAHMEKDSKVAYQAFLIGDCEIISRCDAVFMLPGWQDSEGARRERNHAIFQNKVVYYEEYPEDLKILGI
jgi:hypothetical protein